MEFDYQKIIKTYLNHVFDCGGSSFLGDNGIYGLTPEEYKELKRLDDEATEEYEQFIQRK